MALRKDAAAVRQVCRREVEAALKGDRRLLHVIMQTEDESGGKGDEKNKEKHLFCARWEMPFWKNDDR